MDRPVLPVEADQAPAYAYSKCQRCTNSKCCTYFTQAVDAPRAKRDFDHLLWQISHRGVQVYKEKGGWYLLVHVPCGHLQPDGSCGIYESRPQICRDYSNDYCEFDAPAEDGFELFFPDYESLLAYCKRRFKRWAA
jgi:Fe-S-cluster containining protein